MKSNNGITNLFCVRGALAPHSQQLVSNWRSGSVDLVGLDREVTHPSIVLVHTRLTVTFLKLV